MFGLRNPFRQVEDPPDPPNPRVWVDQQFNAGCQTTRFYCDREIPRSFNDELELCIRAAVTPLKDTGFRAGVRFYRDYLAVSWLPEEDLPGQLELLEEVTLHTLGRLFGMEVFHFPMTRDDEDPWTKLNDMARLRRELGVEWSPTSFQP